MPKTPRVLIVDRDPDRRTALKALVERECRAEAILVSRVEAAEAAMEAATPTIIIARWADGEASALAMRRKSREETEPSTPYLLVLTERVTTAKIALASRTGRVELIPCRPIDMQALGNRITLLLWGAEALRTRAARGAGALAGALEGFPALRRRIAA